MAETEVFLAEREPAVKPRSVKLLSMFERSTANERPSDCVPESIHRPRTGRILFRTGSVITIPILPLHFGGGESIVSWELL